MIKINLAIDHPNYIGSTKQAQLAAETARLNDLIRQQIAEGKKVEFKEVFWGKIKQGIWEVQGKKCCYCERIITSLGEGDVEHYWPKRDAKCIDNRTVLLERGYWWLAYEWKKLHICLPYMQYTEA